MNIIPALERRLTPLKGVIALPDYVALKRAASRIAGSTTVAGYRVRYSDAYGLIHSAAEIFRDHVYRFDARDERPHIIDAGANIGLSVLYFKSRYPDATIVAYEPDPDIFAMLRQNVGAMAGVDLRQAAAWTQDTELTFYREGSLAGSTEVDAGSRKQSVVVRAERLRPELERQVDFLKIDIEGAENDLLFDIEDLLDNVDHLFFEYHSMPHLSQRLGDLLSMVRRRGFRYVINGPHGSPLPFVERISTGFDLQLNVSCFRP